MTINQKKPNSLSLGNNPEKTLKLPYWVTKSLKNDEGLYVFNWKNNKSAFIFEKEHPAFAFSEKDEIRESEIIITTKDQKDDIEWLKENEFIATKKSIEIKRNEIAKEEPGKLHLILLPAGEACNLDCIYCYEDHSDKSRMDKDTAAAIARLAEKQQAKMLEIEYFGGEPLLNIRFMEELREKLEEKNIKFQASITTNGTLLTDFNLEKLYLSGVRSIQITLDGPKRIHNKLRKSKSASVDSFEACCNAIRTLAKSEFHDINVVLRTNLNLESIEEENLEGLISTIKDIVPNSDRRFLIFPKPIGDYLGANLKKNLIATESYCKQGSASKVIEIVEKRLIAEGYALADAFLLTKKGGYSCYAGKINSLVITPDLKLRKCTVALDDPINIVGSLSKDGEIKFSKNIEIWTKDYSDNNCSSCFAQNTCQGNSCPLVNIKNNSKQCPPIKSKKEFITEKLVKTQEIISSEEN